MNRVDQAVALAEQGFHILRLRSGDKRPMRDGKFVDQATRDPSVLATWFWDDAHNIGIATEKFGDDEALLVVDVDKKGNKNGFIRVLELELEGKDFPLTMESATPTGGRHIIYRVPAAVRQGVDVLGDGLDIRSSGGYIVAPGSRVAAGEYFIDRFADPIAAPDWLVAACGAPRERSEIKVDVSKIDQDAACVRAIEYLKTAPEAVEGEGGDATTFKVACKLKDIGVGPETAVDLMAGHWFLGCGWSAEELQTKVDNAYKYGAEPVGVAAPEADFEPIPPAEASTVDEAKAERLAKQKEKRKRKADKDAELHALNQEFKFVMSGGGYHIRWLTQDADGRDCDIAISEEAFHKKHASKWIPVGDDGKRRPLTKMWMEWEGRESYDMLVFCPEMDLPDRFYNTWRGFTHEPVTAAQATPRAKAAVDAWLQHVLQNVCRGNADQAKWVTGFFAHMIQRPWEKPLCALVLKGKKGTGKNVVFDRVGVLFAKNYFVADDNRYLTGNFNSHMESCLALVLDEACWAGDKKAEGKLKGIITGTDHLIERKYGEAYKVANRTRVGILGNENWLVPASQEERRFAVFEMGDEKKQANTYFQEMREGMEADGGQGYGLLLQTLRDFDLTDVDLNVAPKTSALADQKRQSLGATLEWLADSIDEGTLIGGDFQGEWHEGTSTARTRDAYRRYCDDRRITSRRDTDRNFDAAMASVIPNWERHETTPTKRPELSSRHYKWPPLEECRDLMAKYLGEVKS